MCTRNEIITPRSGRRSNVHTDWCELNNLSNIEFADTVAVIALLS